MQGLQAIRKILYVQIWIFRCRLARIRKSGFLGKHGNTIPTTVQFVTPTTYRKINTAKGLSSEVPGLDAEHVQKLTDAEMFYIIKNGVRFTGMPGWDLPDGRVWQLFC